MLGVTCYFAVTDEYNKSFAKSLPFEIIFVCVLMKLF